MAADQTRTRRSGVDTGPRTAAVWAVVSELVRARSAELGRPLHVVDLGGGTGGLAVPLADQGHEVTVVDPSPDALASLRRRATETGVGDRVRSAQGDAESLAQVLGHDRPVDLVCFHGTLEVVDDPEAAVAGIARVLAPGSLLSLVTAQRLAVVLAQALAGQFDQARTALDSPDGRWGAGDPVPRRIDEPALRALLTQHGFEVTSAHGIRLFTDLVPSSTTDSEAARTALLALEAAASGHPVLGQLGAALHLLATRT